jgi:hypothetical protein
MQGKRFWRDQVARIDAEIAATQSVMDALEGITNFRISPELMSQMNEMRDQLRRQYPQLQRSTAQQKAAALREAADEIDHADQMNALMTFYLNRLADLSRLRSIAVARSTSEMN